MTRAALVLALGIAVAGAAPLAAAARDDAGGPAAAQQAATTADLQAPPRPHANGAAEPAISTRTEIMQALVRLPLAAMLGAVLALRPRRRGTPPRTPAVVQTQIILSIVGALVMMVVGTNLARAFGVVGAAGLVRYRAKIDDPKDAGVMLSTLAVGLGAGVGLYVMSAFSAAFVLVVLWLIESFETDSRRRFVLTIKMGKDTDARRRDFEAILRRYRIDFELQTASDDEVCYDARVPLEFPRDRVTNAILKLDPEGHAAVEWSEKKSKAT
jgi:uncharacterized membrane protein YhiD involved in acid resistance